MSWLTVEFFLKNYAMQDGPLVNNKSGHSYSILVTIKLPEKIKNWTNQTKSLHVLIFILSIPCEPSITYTVSNSWRCLKSYLNLIGEMFVDKKSYILSSRVARLSKLPIYSIYAIIYIYTCIYIVQLTCYIKP